VHTVTFSKQAGHILHVLLVVFHNLLTFLTFHLPPSCLSYPAQGILCWLYWFLLWGSAGAKGASFHDDKSENAFHKLKKALMTAHALGLPVQDKFQLYVYEKGGLALDMVTQLRGITPQPVGYLKKSYIR
jgi:hypothetical protein